MDLVPGLSNDNINNWRGTHYEAAGRDGKVWTYSEKTLILLKVAVPLVLAGMAPKNAFKRANEEYREAASKVYAVVSDSLEKSFMGPTVSAVAGALRGALADASAFVQAMVEAKELNLTSSRLTIGGNYSPGAPAFTPSKQAASRELGAADKEWLRTLARDWQLKAAAGLVPSEHIPVSFDFLKLHGIRVERLSLDLGVGGYAELDRSVIVISNAVEPGSAQERKLIAHELFHLVLGHVASDEEDSKVQIEAQATYAAVHFLIPYDSFEFYLGIAESAYPGSLRDQIRVLAQTFRVSTEIMRRYFDELPSLRRAAQRSKEALDTQ